MEPFRKFLIRKINLDELCTIVPRSGTSCVQSIVESSNKKAGFSWMNAEHCQYMCDLLPMVIFVFSNFFISLKLEYLMLIKNKKNFHGMFYF